VIDIGSMVTAISMNQPPMTGVTCRRIIGYLENFSSLKNFQPVLFKVYRLVKCGFSQLCLFHPIGRLWNLSLGC
jgi:hypothetical protein